MTEDTVSSTHPLLPPTSEDDRLDRLRLLRSRRVGISTFNRLMQEHGTARAALDALPDVAREAGLKEYAPFSRQSAQSEIRTGQALGAKMVFQGETEYPHALHDLEDAPPFLWLRGNLEILKRPALALVGARNASSLGTRMTRSLARELGKEGYVIVSGLARGIDTAAHLHSVETGTIAVFAGGVDCIYPSENTQLAETISEKGLILSEQPPGLTPMARHFPARNRLISGLAQAMVVVEAAAKSGSLIAARHALDQGREVMAVPGHPFESRAAGCNMLIRDGARLVRSAADVIEGLPPMEGAQHDPVSRTAVQDALPLPDPVPPQAPKQRNSSTALRDIAGLHDQILSRLDAAPVAEDSLIRSFSSSTELITQQLSTLELDGRIERQSGGMIRRL